MTTLKRFPNGQIFETIATQKEAITYIMDNYRKNRDFLTDDSILRVFYKDGSEYHITAEYESGEFRRTGIYCMIEENECSTVIYGNVLIVPYDDCVSEFIYHAVPAWARPAAEEPAADEEQAADSENTMHCTPPQEIMKIAKAMTIECWLHNTCKVSDDESGMRYHKTKLQGMVVALACLRYSSYVHHRLDMSDKEIDYFTLAKDGEVILEIHEFSLPVEEVISGI